MNLRKLLEALFRRLWLLALPIVLAPAVVVALTTSTPQYQSIATVWVSQPSGIDASAFSQGSNPYLTPAQAQAQAIGDLMLTTAFRAAVGTGAGLPADSADFVGKSVGAYAAGTNIMDVVARTQDPNLSRALVQSLIDQYELRSKSESERGTSISVDYINAQITVAQTELDNRRSAVSDFLAANPRAASATPPNASLQHLQGAVDAQQKIVDGLVASLQDAQLKAAAAPQILEATFSVQDPASPSVVVPTSKTKQLGYPFAALLFGVVVSGAYVYVLYRTDHAIRSSEDLLGLQVPLLGSIPDLSASRSRFATRFNPVAWFLNYRRRDFARAVAASIAHAPTVTPADGSAQ